MNKEINFLFVYGRLREHYASEDDKDVNSLITIPVKTSGKLYDYYGDAVMIEDKEGIVYGNLILATDMKILLRHTDSYMEFNDKDYENSRFIRSIKDIELTTLGEKIKAWCYLFPSTRKRELEKNGTLIPTGEWRDYKKKSLEEK